MITNEIRIMRGPNMWSRSSHHLIIIKYDPVPVSEILPEKQQLLRDYFRSEYHFESSHNDFRLSMIEYTLRLASILQGSSIDYHIAIPAPGIFYGVLEYEIEEAGLESLKLASEMIRSLCGDEAPITFREARQQVQVAHRKYGEGPTSTMIIEAAKKRNIPVTKGPAGFTILGYGKNQKRISAAISQHTSCISVEIACDKDYTKKFLESAYLPVPSGRLARNENELLTIVEHLGYPLVTKPFNGNQGRNVTCGIKNFEELLIGFRSAAEISKPVMIEKEITGYDYRMLVIGNKFIAASLRQPASVIGDGSSTISELVKTENLNHLRGDGHENALTKISLDSVSEQYLQKQGLQLDTIPAKGQQVFLRSTANLSTGGTAEDVTDTVHPANKVLAEKASKVIGLDICGIDVISPDITRPFSENGSAIIEINAAPGLRMHKYPTKGESREVGEPIIDLMFPQGDEGRIPIVAITGTNGKTTTTRLMAHTAAHAGYTVGFSSTDGIYVGDERIKIGDCSGPQSAHTVLQDTTVDFAVLECARGGIIRSGLGFDLCDIAIVTNVAADHLGLKDIYTVADLADVKAVVPCAVKKEGWAILNAGNEYTYGMKDKVKCKVALFCSDENNPRLQEHMKNGGSAVYTDRHLNIFIYNNACKIFVFNAAEAPVTCHGKAEFMIENMLPVVLAAYFSGIPTDGIMRALKGFTPNAEQAPGRINEFEINGVNVIIDYAHNPHGLKALAGYLRHIKEKKTGIITIAGDRRDEDIIEFGQIAASMYDHIIIKFDRDTRGRSEESTAGLLAQGIRDVKPDFEYRIIADTQAAIHFAIDTAEKGSYVVICADDAAQTLNITQYIAGLYED
ncbi:cyanophycin synthetase [Chryseobacterium sp. SN22]|uniref:cyanophycin synthetase n=1 Tax=Chryseobacterium sp. SN22 TaxID=2606431 RepID=UPI0011EFAF51|nr:cyanophycin synthetase [Chryseobacterium sp. SN22]KAA0128401.1 cyanophycin synthetase [Chryseobacterium sp. SN22]